MYSGTEQQVITEGEHYNVTSGTNSAVNAGTVTLTVKPEEGYIWADGSSGEKTVTGEIKKRRLGVRYKDDVVLVNGTPKFEIEYGYMNSDISYPSSDYNFVNGETEETASGFVAPKVPAHATDVAGDYTLTPEGGSADNYEFVLSSGVLHVMENADHIVKIPEIWTDSVYPVKKRSETSRTYIVPKDEQTIKTVKAFDIPDENAGYTLSSNNLSASLSTNKPGVYGIEANVKDGYVWEDGTTRTKYYTLYLYQIIDKPEAKETLVFNGKEQSLFDEETITAGEGKWGFIYQTIYKATEPGIMRQRLHQKWVIAGMRKEMYQHLRTTGRSFQLRKRKWLLQKPSQRTLH